MKLKALFIIMLIFLIAIFLCKEFGMVLGQELISRVFIDKNGKVMTYATFSGGNIQLSEDVFETWIPKS